MPLTSSKNTQAELVFIANNCKIEEARTFFLRSGGRQSDVSSLVPTKLNLFSATFDTMQDEAASLRFCNRVIKSSGDSLTCNQRRNLLELFDLIKAGRLKLFLLLNSGGGNARKYEGWLKIIGKLRPKTSTYAGGYVASAAAQLLMATDERYVLPLSQIVFHAERDEADRATKTDYSNFRKYLKQILSFVISERREELQDIMFRQLTTEADFAAKKVVLTGHQVANLGLAQECPDSLALQRQFLQDAGLSKPPAAVTDFFSTLAAEELAAAFIKRIGLFNKGRTE